MSRPKRIACIVGALVAILFALAAPSAEANGGGQVFSSQRTVSRTRVARQRTPIFARNKTVIVNQQAAYVAPTPVVFQQQRAVFRAPVPVYVPQAAPVFVPQFAPAYSYGAAVQFAAPSCATGGCH